MHKWKIHSLVADFKYDFSDIFPYLYPFHCSTSDKITITFSSLSVINLLLNSLINLPEICVILNFKRPSKVTTSAFSVYTQHPS